VNDCQLLKKDFASRGNEIRRILKEFVKNSRKKNGAVFYI
jgi:hypothetical protein